MANTLTNLTPDLYAALDTVSRELVGFIPAVAMDASLERAAKDQPIRSFVAPAVTAADITAGQQAPNTGDQTFANKTITISKARAVPIRWNGEEQRAMDTGPGANAMFQDQVAQAIRVLVNEVEADLAALYNQAATGVAPAGTNLFDANNFKDAANVRKQLVDNGAPLSDMQLILSTAAGAQLRGNNVVLNSAADAGSLAFRQQGLLLPIHGMELRESAQIAEHTAGTASGAQTDTAGYAVGDTAITLNTAGSGAIAAGDVVTIGAYNYVVATGGNATGGSIVLAAPGLKAAIATAATNITVVAYSEANMAFHRNAIQLVTRLPAEPRGGDAADDVMVMQDPRSGLAFEVRAYKEYRQVHYELGLAWGVAAIKPEHIALLVD